MIINTVSYQFFSTALAGLYKRMFDNHHLNFWLFNWNICYKQSIFSVRGWWLQNTSKCVYRVDTIIPSQMKSKLFWKTEAEREETRDSERCRLFAGSGANAKNPWVIASSSKSDIASHFLALDGHQMTKCNKESGKAADWHQRWTPTKTVYESYWGKIDPCSILWTSL